MTPNLYKTDSIEEPMEIEKDLAKYECEIADLINNKFLKLKEFDLTSSEMESLLLFCAIMAFRSKRVSDMFGENATEENKEYYRFFQEDGDIHAFWTRNLGRLAKHRSLQEVVNDTEIDIPIKMFMMRDTRGMSGFGLFPVLVERRGRYDFFLTDVYPTLFYAEGPDGENGLKIPLYTFFPLSPERMLILIPADISLYHQDVRPFGESIIRIPFIDEEKGTAHIKLRKFYEREVRYVNALALNNISTGVVFKDPSRFKLETDWRTIL